MISHSSSTAELRAQPILIIGAVPRVLNEAASQGNVFNLGAPRSLQPRRSYSTLLAFSLICCHPNWTDPILFLYGRKHDRVAM